MVFTREKQLNILLIEDESESAELIEAILVESGDTAFSLTCSPELVQGLAQLKKQDFDIILLDLRSPDGELLEALEKVKKQTPTIPIVVLTNSSNRDFSLTAVRLGAQDCLAKGRFDGDLLMRSINYAIERQRIKEELQQTIARERLMGRIIERVRCSLDLRHILDTTVSEVRQLLNTERVFIYCIVGNEKGRIVAEAGKELVTEDELEVNGQLIANIQPLLWNLSDLSPQQFLEYQESLESLSEDTQDGLHSILSVPIWQNRPEREPRLWGQLIAQKGDEGRQWQGWEVEFLSQLADQVAIAILQSELYQAVERQASVDGLTGIANRRHFDQALGEEWQKHAQNQQLLSLILCDVDFFKQYNDSYGHLAGDDCLKKVASVIAKTCQRLSDLPCRYGGEEFAVILPKTTPEGAFKVAQTIQANLKQLQLPHEYSRVSSLVTLSIGIATMIPDAISTPKTLLEEADRSLLAAKAAGRNRIIPHSSRCG